MRRDYENKKGTDDYKNNKKQLIKGNNYIPINNYFKCK